MARKARINIPGMPYHVIQRGNNRQACFFADEDYRFYLECLQEALEKYHCELHAYVLMTNHVHLLVTTHKDDGISRLMQSIGRRYVQYINYTYRRTGTLWEGRFKSSLVDADNYLLTCQRYIELNPVRAAMVDSPDQYQWSSYRHNAFGVRNELITAHALYTQLGSTNEFRQQQYRELFRNQMSNDTLHDIRESLSTCTILGNDHFKEQIGKMLKKSVRSVHVGRPRKYKVREPKAYYAVNRL